MTDRELDVGMKVRLYGYEVWTVTQCFIDLCNTKQLAWEIKRGCCKKIVRASSLHPYNG